MDDLIKIIIRQKEGIRLVKENSINLFNSAQLLSTNKYYSPAIPLLILSSEEIIKCFALCLEILLGDQSEVKKIIKGSKLNKDNSYLYNHEDKHKLAHALINDLTDFSKFADIMSIILKGKIREVVLFLSLPKEDRLKIESLLIELHSFNKLKNEGFYVDFTNNSWMSPLSLTEEEYLKIYNYTRLIHSIFIPEIHHFLNYSNNDLGSLYQAMNEIYD